MSVSLNRGIEGIDLLIAPGHEAGVDSAADACATRSTQRQFSCQVRGRELCWIRLIILDDLSDTGDNQLNCDDEDPRLPQPCRVSEQPWPSRRGCWNDGLRFATPEFPRRQTVSAASCD